MRFRNGVVYRRKGKTFREREAKIKIVQRNSSRTDGMVRYRIYDTSGGTFSNTVLEDKPQKLKHFVPLTGY